MPCKRGLKVCALNCSTQSKPAPNLKKDREENIPIRCSSRIREKREATRTPPRQARTKREDSKEASEGSWESLPVMKKPRKTRAREEVNKDTSGEKLVIPPVMKKQRKTRAKEEVNKDTSGEKLVTPPVMKKPRQARAKKEVNKDEFGEKLVTPPVIKKPRQARAKKSIMKEAPDGDLMPTKPTMPRKDLNIAKQKKSLTPPTNIRPRSVEVPKVAMDRQSMEKSRRQVIFDSRKSTGEGWNRLLGKYSPSKEAAMSPIKASQANLIGVIIKDLIVDMYTWVTNMSEQHFYDNTFLLLSSTKKDPDKIAKILHRGFVGVDMEFFNSLESITLLGKGAFGSVYSCVDAKTKLKYAVKHINGEFKSHREHVSQILAYIGERNANVRAMDSAFVIKFYYSLQIRKTGDLFLFFEFCIGDLSGYLKRVDYPEPDRISLLFYHNKIDILKQLYKGHEELLEVSFLYIFEMFCALDFLVQCNIVHQDIKPENIMISNSLHLKIGDFGLTYKTRAIRRETNTMLMTHANIKNNERIDYNFSLEGTMEFQDFESQLMIIEIDNQNAVNVILKEKDVYDTPQISYDNAVLEPSFLVDTWAAGVVAVMLLYRGLILSEPEHMYESIYPNLPRHDMSLFIAKMVAQKSIYSRYIRNGLIYGGGKCNSELMGFIASIFKPRLARCVTFTKEKIVHHYANKVKMRYVDISKFESFQTFKVRGFNRSNMHLRDMPPFIRNAFRQNSNYNFRVFEELLNDINMERSKKTGLNAPFTMEPGVTMNFFT